MKTENAPRRFASHKDYLERTPVKLNSIEKGLTKAKASEFPKEKVDLTPKNESVKEDVAKTSKETGKKVEEKLKETGKLGKHLMGEVGNSLGNMISSQSIPGVLGPDLPPVAEVKASEKTGDKEVTKLINKPGIFFVKGFSLNPFESDDEGLGAMANNIPSAETFSWSAGDKIIETIKTRPHSQPLILVGHGVGGDTAVDVANRLNSVEHGFRRVDLLVTLDSVGTDNDIIPQNVKENLNLISDRDFLINDGPNVARNKHLTNVTNELRPESHSELEDSAEVQFLVYDKINTVLLQAIAERDSLKVNGHHFLRSHRFLSPNANL